MDKFHADMLALAVTPGILISGCGLVTAALYNRLGVILTRIRAYHQRKMEALADAHRHEVVESQSLHAMLDAQIEAVTAKAKMVRNGLYCLFAAIVALLLCSVFAGLATLHDGFGVAALALGFVGVCLFVGGLGWAVREISCALSPIEEETAYLKVLTTQHGFASQTRSKLKIAS
jgi:uncharacterized protein YunC (DUF1805 family)